LSTPHWSGSKTGLHTRELWGEGPIAADQLSEYVAASWLSQLRFGKFGEEIGFNTIEYREHALFVIFSVERIPRGFAYSKGEEQSVASDLLEVATFGKSLAGALIISSHTHPPGCELTRSFQDGEAWSWMKTIFEANGMRLVDNLILPGSLDCAEFYSDRESRPWLYR